MRHVRQPNESTHGILEPDAGRAHFRLTRSRPSIDLADYIERHWVLSWDMRGRAPFVQQILPNPSVNLSSEPGLIAVYGIGLKRSFHSLESAGTVVGTKFLPGAFAGFAQMPAFTLNDRVASLEEVFSRPGLELSRLLERCEDAESHIEAVEEFLRARMPPPDPRFELVSAAVREILKGDPRLTVAELASRHAVSERTLQRVFRDYVGVGPKWVLKRYRVQEAAERIAADEAEDPVALALELGYYDQAHFIRDFTAQVGRSPGAYARACADARDGALSSQAKRA